MLINKRMCAGILILFLIVGLVFIALWKVKDSNSKNNLTPISEVKVENREIADLYEAEELYLKVDSFVRERIPASDIFFEFDLETENLEPPSIEELRKEFFNMFYAAVKTRDMNLFTLSLSGNSIQDIWDGELNIVKRISKMENFLDRISREGKLKSVQYQFLKDENELITDKGTFYMIYEDDVEIPIQFELELIGDDEERYYQFSNTINEMNQLYLNLN